eukprot:10411201-Prorocentrum_lima.AAC.1
MGTMSPARQWAQMADHRDPKAYRNHMLRWLLLQYIGPFVTICWFCLCAGGWASTCSTGSRWTFAL